jgi:hypothetical protein
VGARQPRAHHHERRRLRGQEREQREERQ